MECILLTHGHACTHVGIHTRQKINLGQWLLVVYCEIDHLGQTSAITIHSRNYIWRFAIWWPCLTSDVLNHNWTAKWVYIVGLSFTSIIDLTMGMVFASLEIILNIIRMFPISIHSVWQHQILLMSETIWYSHTVIHKHIKKWNVYRRLDLKGRNAKWQQQFNQPGIVSLWRDIHIVVQKQIIAVHCFNDVYVSAEGPQHTAAFDCVHQMMHLFDP